MLNRKNLVEFCDGGYHLNLTERQQDIMVQGSVGKTEKDYEIFRSLNEHKCMLYNIKLYHRGYHPNIFRPIICREDNNKRIYSKKEIKEMIEIREKEKIYLMEEILI